MKDKVKESKYDHSEWIHVVVAGAIVVEVVVEKLNYALNLL